MCDTSLSNRLAAGVTGRVAATLALQSLRSATAKRFPQTTPPIENDPGTFMIERVESQLPKRVTGAVPAWVKAVAGQSLALAAIDVARSRTVADHPANVA